MRTRFFALAALAALAVLPRPVISAEGKTLPTLVVRLQSLDGLIDNARYLAEIAGKAEEAKQAEGMLKSLAGPKGIEGIDTKKPFGLYGKLGPNGIDSEAVILVPIADEDAALDLIKRFAKPEKGDGGVYTVMVEQSPFPIYFRFANGYAYITIKDKDAIDKDRLLAPGDVLAPAKVGTVSATINLDQIPKELKKLAIGQLELQLANAKEQKEARATEAQHELKGAFLDEFAATFKQVLTEGGPIDLRLDIDKKAGDLNITASLAGNPETTLAETIASLGKKKSSVVGLIGSDSAINMLGHITLPERIKKAFVPVVEEAAEKALKQETDKTKKKLGEMAYKAVLPTLKAAELDIGLSMRGPHDGGKYALVMGMKVKDGGGIEKVIKEAISELPESEREKFKADFAKANGISIHQVPADGLDANTKEMLGDGPLFLAIRPDGIFLSGGEGGLDAIKETVGAAGGASPIAQFEMSVNRSAKILAKEQKGAVEIAKKAFAKDKEADKMRIRLEGGKALTFSFTMKTQLVKFFTLLDEAKKKGGADE